MNELSHRFHKWLSTRDLRDCEVIATDAEHVEVRGASCTGTVSFYCFDDMSDIVEMRVSRNGFENEDPVFFLHFELNDLERAQELFEEMVSVIVRSDNTKTVRVLLCCSVGMTTSMFSAKLNEVAKTLSLDYVFEARALEDAKDSGGDYAAVLLAPQVGYRRREVAVAFPDAVVAEIPAVIFGTYDAAGALRMLMGLLGDRSLAHDDPTDLRIMREMHNDRLMLLISVIRRPKNCTIAYRVYDGFRLVVSDEVHKCLVGYLDIEDVMATLHLKGIDVTDLDAVGIALPGFVDYGRVTTSGLEFEDSNVEQALVNKFGVQVFVDNNANAAAVGCYMSQDKYDSVAMHTQQVGLLIGGQGTVANGHLIRGRRGVAGELAALSKYLFLKCGLDSSKAPDMERELSETERYTDIPWRSDRMLPVLATMLLANITVTAPDAIYIAYDLVDDMDALRAELSQVLPEEYIPDLIHVTDYHERIFAGEMALVLQRLSTAAD